MAYQTIPESSSGGSGGTASMASAIYSFAVSEYPTISRYIETEVRSTSVDYSFQTIAPNVATNTQTQVVKGGVTQVATSAAGAGGGLVIRIGSATAPIAANAKTDVPWFVAGILTMPTTIDANTQAAVVMETITFSAAIVAGAVGAVDTTNYSLAIGATTATSTTPIDTSGAYVLLMLGFDGTTIRSWVSTPAGILTTAPTALATTTSLVNVPTAASSGMILLHQNSAVASKTVRVDYLFEAWAGAV